MKNLKKIPRFKDYAEEARFWDTHDFSEFWSDAKPVRIDFLDVPQKEKTITVRVQTGFRRRLEEIARNYGISVSALTRMWLIKKLRQIGKV